MGDGEPPTIEALWQAWADHASTYYRKPCGRPTGEAVNVEHAFRSVLNRYSTLNASKFTVAHLRHVREAMIDEGLSRSTINARVNRIRRVFTWAVSMELVPPHALTSLRSLPPLKRGRSHAKEHPPVSPVAWHDVRATLAYLRDPTSALVEVLWWTGMRVSEALTMRPCEIDRSSDVWSYRPSEHKCDHLGHERIVPLGPNAQRVVQRCLYRLGSLLFPDEKTRVFEFHSGRCHTPGTLRQAVQRAAAQAGVPLWTPLQLRHAAATRLRAEVGLEAARVVLGHSSPSTTEIYAEVDRAKARSLMLRFG